MAFSLRDSMVCSLRTSDSLRTRGERVDERGADKTGFKAGGAPRKKTKCVEGARQKKNGKWSSSMFPGREFDDLDELRAAKKEHYSRREEYRAQRR